MTVRIGIDARAAAEVPAGRGRVARELIRELARRDDAHEYVLYGRSAWTDETLDERFRWLIVPRPDPLWNIEVGLRSHRDSDAFLSLDSYLTAWFTRAPTAVFVHDLIAWEVPESAQSRAARIERATIRPALRRAQRLLCNSRSTFEDLTRRFPHTETKASVVPLAASALFGGGLDADRLESTKRNLGLDRPFVLSTGTLEPRKNLVRLIDAFGMLPDGVRQSHELVLVGPRGWEYEEITARASGDVRILGQVPDEDLAALYELCQVFCYPSLYEGFGLPLLEAMQSGAASIASKTSSLPEVGGDAVRYVDPHDTRGLASELESLLTDADARVELGRRARERARIFSWSRTADGIVGALTAIARRGSGA